MTISDINAEARSWCDADTTSYTAANLLRRVNQAYETVISWIINADGDWQWDDTNRTDLNIGTYTMVAGQGRYSFNDKFLQLMEVQVKNSSGDWVIIDPIDQKEVRGNTPLSQLYETNGMPRYYDKETDDTFTLYPAPSATDTTLTQGLKVKFKRTADLFTTAQVTTGTKEPGFASPFHILLAWMAARPHCMSYKKDRVQELNVLIGDMTQVPTGMKKDLLAHYGRREKDKRKIATTKGILFR